MATQKNILLLGNDPADQQWSILDYGEQLHRALIALAENEFQISLKFPHTPEWHRIRRSRIGRAALMYWSRYVHYPEVVRKARADVYHFLDYGNIWVIRYLNPNRTVATCHDLIPLVLHHRRESLCPQISAAAYRHSLSGLTRAAAILADTACTKQDIITYLGYPANRIHVVPLGIDPCLRPTSTREMKNYVRSTFSLPQGVILLHTGQSLFYKNLEGVLHTLQILLQRMEPVWLARAGAFFQQKQRQLAKRLGITDRIIELGPLPREQIRQLYQIADLLIYPSWYEGFGLPPLEAMACGVPVVVSNRGALPETVGDAALIVDPDDPTQLANAVQRLLHDPSLQTDLRTRGLARAAQFRWETTARKTLEVYRSLLQ